VRRAQSVLNVLEFGGSLAQVPDEVIAAIRQEMDGQEIREIHTPLQPGDSVMIAAGPMRGFQGIVHSLRSGEDRVRVLLDFLGSQHPVEMPTHTVLSPRSARSVLADQTRQQGA
jgi:transcription antitermination factor NusG